MRQRIERVIEFRELVGREFERLYRARNQWLTKHLQTTLYMRNVSREPLSAAGAFEISPVVSLCPSKYCVPLRSGPGAIEKRPDQMRPLFGYHPHSTRSYETSRGSLGQKAQGQRPAQRVFRRTGNIAFALAPGPKIHPVLCVCISDSSKSPLAFPFSVQALLMLSIITPMFSIDVITAPRLAPTARPYYCLPIPLSATCWGLSSASSVSR